MVAVLALAALAALAAGGPAAASPLGSQEAREMCAPPPARPPARAPERAPDPPSRPRACRTPSRRLDDGD